MRVFTAPMVATKGRLEFGQWDQTAYRKFAATLGDGTEWLMVIKKKPSRQGSQSMRYYRGVVVPDIAEACGYSDPDDFDAVHESLAWKFLRIEDHPQLGFPRRRSTAKVDMNAEEMSAYISKCIDWAEFNIVGCKVRRPNEVDLDSTPFTWQPNDSEAA